jgi:hypothetical protein
VRSFLEDFQAMDVRCQKARLQEIRKSVARMYTHEPNLRSFANQAPLRTLGRPG